MNNTTVIIPMSGLGTRFINAGYSTPKPLIEVDGKPILEHLIELYKNISKRFIFICNDHHLSTTDMSIIIDSISMKTNIEHHILKVPVLNRKGPVDAVLRVKEEIMKIINHNDPVIVSYCDYGTYWTPSNFLKHLKKEDPDGCIFCYKGFHPHMLGTDNYAFVKTDSNIAIEIKEKEPFTNDRMNEYASNGGYYFKKLSVMYKYFSLCVEKGLMVNNEYYVSMVYNLLIKDYLKVTVYEIDNMLQWGTPSDLEEYMYWSNIFKKLKRAKSTCSHSYIDNVITLLPMAGEGSRFKNNGYIIPKPFLNVLGKEMFKSVLDFLPKTNRCCLGIRTEYSNYSSIMETKNVIAKKIDHTTNGQATTCELMLKELELEISEVMTDKGILITPCDSAAIFNVGKFENMVNEGIDVIVLVVRNHMGCIRNPQMYGWVKTDDDGNIVKSSIKKAISTNPKNDAVIIGTFYFRKTSFYHELYNKMLERNLRTNDEFYVDNMLALITEEYTNISMRSLDVSGYMCWGTPTDYMVFNYWEDFFNKCEWHQYKRE